MEIIQTKLIKIGNSKGIRIPKHILDRLDILNEIELVIDDENNQIYIRPLNYPRKGWEEHFKKMHKMKEDELLIDDNLDFDSDFNSDFDFDRNTNTSSSSNNDSNDEYWDW